VSDDTSTVQHESPIRRILVESALIVFSILLALGVNQWVDARKQSQLTARVLRSVRDEITANRTRVQEWLPYHRAMELASHRADSLRAVHSYADFKSAAPQWSGFKNPELDGTAWQTAVSLGVVNNMGFDTVRVLSSLYTMQAKYDQYWGGTIQSFDFADATMANTVRRMWVYFATIRTNEDSLVNRYTEALRLFR